MKAINVEDLPEPMALAVQSIVETLRQQVHAGNDRRPRVELPRWPGTVIGRARREEIYDDVR
jgi:hypothetical protein